MKTDENEILIKYAAKHYQTPFYLFHTDILAEQVEKIRTALGRKVELCFAMKANPFVIKTLEPLVDFFEVCSPGEFSICERAKIKMEKLVFSGVHKNLKDIDYAVSQYGNQPIFTIESLSHWKIIKSCADKYHLPLRVLIRLTSGNQFGMDEDLIRDILSEGPYEYVEIEGIQYFSGTQKKSAKKIQAELKMLDQFCLDLEQKFHFTVKKLEYGPGLPICYFEEENSEEYSMLSALYEGINNLEFQGRITLEMGRFLAASCGFYVTSIVDRKQNKGQNYCIADGGIHHLNYYGQLLAMKKPPILHLGQTKGEPENWTVCGSLCTANDVLVKQYPFKNLQTGDQLVFKKTGAYSVTEGMSLFLSRDLPLILLYSSKESFFLARPCLHTDTLNYTHL